MDNNDIQKVPNTIAAKIEARVEQQKSEAKERKYSRTFKLVKPGAELLMGSGSTPQQKAVIKAIMTAAKKSSKDGWVSSDQVIAELMDVDSQGFLVFKTRINLLEEYGKPSHKAACIEVISYYESRRWSEGKYDVR
jgi:hypothetical protein